MDLKAIQDFDNEQSFFRDRMLEVEQAASQWLSRWPKHCRTCQGWGGSTHRENHGFAGGGSEPICEQCEAIEKPAVCHRCGEAGLTEDGQGPCSVCGWNYDDGKPEF